MMPQEFNWLDPIKRTAREMKRRASGRPPHALLSAMLFVSLAMIGVPGAKAQPYREWRDTTLVPEKKPFGIAESDFPIGFYALNYNFDRPLPELWSYMQSMAFTFVEIFVEKYGVSRGGSETKWERYRSFLTSPLRPPGAKLVPAIEYSPSILAEAGNAQEIVFYPFDSSQMRAAGSYAARLFEHVAAGYGNGRTEFNKVNPAARNSGTGAALRESVFDVSDSGARVLEGIGYNWKPEQRYRFPEYYDPSSRAWKRRPDGTTIDAEELLREKKQPTNLYYIVLTGHVFPAGSAADSDTLLRVNLYYEVPRGQAYHDSSGMLQTAAANMRFHYTTLWGRKEHFRPGDPSNPQWDQLRQVALPVDLGNCPTCEMGGPLYAGNQSRRLDLEVVYLGKEKLALHSVALRDSIAHLLITEDEPGQAYRRALYAEVDSLVTDMSGNLLPQIFALSPVGEPPATNFAGFREVDRLLGERYRNVAGEGLAAWTELGVPYVHHLANADWVVPEVYFNVVGMIPRSEIDYTRAFDLPHQQPPSITQHNGGRWNIPELFDLDSIGSGEYNADVPEKIARYEETIQTMLYGAYMPGNPPWPYNGTRTMELARYARTARANGRRMLAIVGPNSNFRLGPENPGGGARDTIVSHRPEPGELRTMANLAVYAYGAKGISYYDMSMYPWFRKGGDGSYQSDVIGFGGEWVGDTTRQILDFAFCTPGTADTLLLVTDYYLGLRSIHEELRAINARLTELGPLLAGLRWRDAYSLHWQVRRPGKGAEYPPRPLPPDEIVTKVTAWHPITGLTDLPWETYVELGLFETKAGTTNGVRDRMKDTNYVGVVNRRGFERPHDYEVSYSAAAARTMDTLSEARTIELQLNLANPDEASGYNRFVRVREVLPDNSPLPVIGPRLPLDTIVQHDARGRGAVRLTLGSGRAALLEITWVGREQALELWRRGKW